MRRAEALSTAALWTRRSPLACSWRGATPGDTAWPGPRCDAAEEFREEVLCAWAQQVLAAAQRRAGALAEASLRRALAGYAARFLPDSLELADIERELGELALAQGRRDDAVASLRQAESIYAASAEPDYVPLAQARVGLARALAGDEARGYAELALATYAGKGPAFAAEAAEARSLLDGP